MIIFIEQFPKPHNLTFAKYTKSVFSIALQFHKVDVGEKLVLIFKLGFFSFFRKIFKLFFLIILVAIVISFHLIILIFFLSDENFRRKKFSLIKVRVIR